MEETEPLSGLSFFKTKPVKVGYVSIDDYKINFEIHGNGKKRILFLTGFMSSTGVWNDLVKYFSTNDYSCMVVNNRGFSRSTNGKLACYSTSNMAQDVIRVIEHCNWDEPKSIHLVGLSMGGMISQEIALARPDLIKSLALLATFASLTLPTTEHKLMPIKLFLPRFSAERRLEFLVDLLFSDEEWLESTDSTNKNYLSNRDIAYHSIVEQQKVDGKAPLRTFLGQLGAVLTHHVSPERLQIIGQEIGVNNVVCITGKNDKMIHYSATEHLVEYIKCKAIYLEKKGHGLPKEAHVEIISALETLFQKSQ